MKLTKKDFNWLYAFPVYIFLNSLRHQLANLLAIWMTGGRVLRYSVLPTFRPGWLGGNNLAWMGGETWFILAAPYMLDLITFLIFFVVVKKVVLKQHWLWINVLILGLALPIINTAYGYFISLFVKADVSQLIDYMHFEEILHLAFIVIFCFYVLAFQYLLRNSATSAYYKEQAEAERRLRKLAKKKKNQNGHAAEKSPREKP